jgi:hypothetical protein
MDRASAGPGRFLTLTGLVAAVLFTAVPLLQFTGAAALANDSSQGRERTIVFSGYEWVVKSSQHRVGPGPNVFSHDNVNVDAAGRLRLRIARRGDTWTSAEISSRRAFGYGTFRFTVVAGPRDPQAVLGLFTWDEDASDQYYREIDIEISRWGDPDNPNAQCIVQPSRRPGNTIRFEMSEGPAVHEFTWTRHGVSCLSQLMYALEEPSTPSFFHRHDLRESPPEGRANARINLWLFDGLPAVSGAAVEAIVERFEFIPES